MTADDETRQLSAACQDLVREFADRLEPAQVDALFTRVVAGFEGAPVRTFVPVLAQRAVRQELARQG